MTPLLCGYRPVNRDARDALQPGCVQNERANRTPCSANLSKLGVHTVLTP